jgi:hypothetical protein
MVIQLVATGLATQLMDLKEVGSSLISKDQSIRVKLNEEIDVNK